MTASSTSAPRSAAFRLSFVRVPKFQLRSFLNATPSRGYLDAFQWKVSWPALGHGLLMQEDRFHFGAAVG
jgi:hypothetical protein